MKKFKTVIYTLVLLLVFSCNTNEELVEIENVKVEKEIQTFSRGGTPDDIPSNPTTSTSKILIEYMDGTTEIEKQNVRDSYPNLISYEQCPSNIDREIWTIIELTQSEFVVGMGQDLDNESDIQERYYEVTCN